MRKVAPKTRLVATPGPSAGVRSRARNAWRDGGRRKTSNHV